MFQQLVMSKHAFPAVEPGKRERDDAGDASSASKQTKTRSSVEEHLFKLRQALNGVSRVAAGSWSSSQLAHLENLQNELRLAIREEAMREFNEDSSDDEEEDLEPLSERFSAMRAHLEALLASSPDLAGQLAELQTILYKKLPSELGEDVRETDASWFIPGALRPDAADGSSDEDIVDDDSDDDVMIPYRRGYKPEPGEQSSSSSSDDEPSESVVDDTDSDEPKAEMKSNSSGRQKKQKQPDVGNVFKVTLINHTGKHNKLTRLLSKSPQELVLAGIGAATAEFWMPGANHKNKAITILRSSITMEPVSGIETPEMLLPGMLMEMRWEGDPTWYSVTYSLANGALYRCNSVSSDAMVVDSTPIGDSHADLQPNIRRDIVVHLRGDDEKTPGKRYSNVLVSSYTPLETTLSGQFPENTGTVYIFGKCGVILVSDGSLYEFDPNVDDWRYPKYPVFVEEDQIRLQTDSGPRIAVVTEVQDKHRYVCEWSKKQKDDPKNFDIDVYYTQAVKVDEERQVSEASEDEELSEDEEDHEFEKNEVVDYMGSSYKVVSVHVVEDGYEYTIKNRSGEIRVTEKQLRDTWDPEFREADDVVYNNEAATVVGIDYASRQYEIVLDSASDDAPALAVSAGSVEQMPELVYDVGTIVFYNFGYYTVSSVRLTYTLRSESGEEVSGITDDELTKWILVLDPKNKTNDIWCVIGQTDKKVKGEYLPHYHVKNAAGKKKWIRAGSKNIKEQADAESFFDDAMRSDEELDKVVVFNVGERVTIIGAGSGDKDTSGIVVRRIVAAELDDEQYEINVNGEIKVYPVGQITRIDEETPEQIVEEIGDTVTDENGATWTIVSFEDGQAIWREVVESSSSSESEEDIIDSDEEDDSDFKRGEYVTLDDEPEVYEITEAKNNQYALISAWDEFNVLENIDVDRLKRYENSFGKNEEVLFDGKRNKIAEVREDGFYLLQTGLEVTEDQLEPYIAALKKGTIVRVVGSGVVYKVKSHKKGAYTLVKLEDQTTVADIPDEDIVEHEEPLFKVKEYARLEGEKYPRRVTKFKAKNWSYKLEGLDTYFREMQLREPAEPEFEPDAKVIVKETGEVSTIKKVIRERGSYLLKNGQEVKEEDLEAAEDED